MHTPIPIPAFEVDNNFLKNKVIVVTGASSGIGQAVATCCAQHGATVVLLGRSMPALEKVYDEIDAQNLPQPAIFQMDFEQAGDADFAGLKNSLENEFGQINAIIHNAAQRDASKPLEQIGLDEWQRIFAINVHACFGLTRHLLPLMASDQPGNIIFTVADTALQGKAFHGAYGVSNAARLQLMQALAEEYEHSSIRINALMPGPTRTAMRAAAYPGENPSELVSPSLRAERYLYLLGDRGMDHHGQVFRL